MIRENYRLIDPRNLTPEERGLRIMELHTSILERMKQEKENPAPPPSEKIERLGTCARSPQGRIPFGFQQNPYGRAVHEGEAKWVQRIEALASQKFSLEKIAQALNKEDHETKRAGKWSRTAVWRILQRSKKSGVTKSFRNGTAQMAKSGNTPVIASKAPPVRIRTSLSTESVSPPNSEFSKPLRINDFHKTLPGSNSLQNTPNALNALCLWDKFDFGPIFESKGRVRLVRRKAFEAHQIIRASKAPVPKPPAIQGLLEKAYNLKKQLDTAPGLTRFALAKRLGLDPTRISQILNLLNLAPRIQAYVQSLEPTIHHPAISDRDWNRLARIRDHVVQTREFDALFEGDQSSLSKTVPRFGFFKDAKLASIA